MSEDAKAAEKRRLAEALRANLRRRKAARSPQPAEKGAAGIQADPAQVGSPDGVR